MKGRASRSLFVIRLQQCLWLIDRLRLTEEEKHAAYKGNLEGITSLCWNWEEYKIARWKDSSIYTGASFSVLFLLQEAQGAFTKSHFINLGYLQLIKPNNRVYYSMCSHIFLPQSAFDSHRVVVLWKKKKKDNTPFTNCLLSMCQIQFFPCHFVAYLIAGMAINSPQLLKSPGWHEDCRGHKEKFSMIEFVQIIRAPFHIALIWQKKTGTANCLGFFLFFFYPIFLFLLAWCRKFILCPILLETAR